LISATPKCLFAIFFFTQNCQEKMPTVLNLVFAFKVKASQAEKDRRGM
jgi:hypothetical protein